MKGTAIAPRTLTIWALLPATWLAAPALAANLVANPSFELPNIVGGSYVLYTTASTAITGWTVLGPAGDSVSLNPDTYLGLRASDGRQFIDMTGITGYDKGLRADAIATVVGATYRLEFDVGNYLPFGISTLGVSINGGVEKLFTNTSLAVTATNPMNWQRFGFDWVANSPSASLSFLGRANGASSNDLGICLDNVGFALAPVPEAPPLALMGLGLPGLASLRAWRLRGACVA